MIKTTSLLNNSINACLKNLSWFLLCLLIELHYKFFSQTYYTIYWMIVKPNIPFKFSYKRCNIWIPFIHSWLISFSLAHNIPLRIFRYNTIIMLQVLCDVNDHCFLLILMRKIQVYSSDPTGKPKSLCFRALHAMLIYEVNIIPYRQININICKYTMNCI